MFGSSVGCGRPLCRLCTVPRNSHVRIGVIVYYLYQAAPNEWHDRNATISHTPLFAMPMLGFTNRWWLLFLLLLPLIGMSILSKLQNFLQTESTVVFSSALRQSRQVIARDTLEHIDSVVSSTPGASLDSEFVREEDMPPLTHDDVAVLWPNYPTSEVKIVNSDAFALARSILKESPDSNVSVLNLASDEHPGGGWFYTLAQTQEEALCYSSTLYPTLKEIWYPWTGSVMGIYSPAVVVFKDDLMHNCTYLPQSERIVVSVLTFAAPCVPELTRDNLSFASQTDLDSLRAKIRLLLRTAARRGQDTLVLGAMGCGVYGCPPRQVAEEMRDALQSDEFRGWFRRVDFAVYSTKDPNFVGTNNFDIFYDVFQGVTV
ncbi:hypothetical protein BKA62DRAFT_725744 [Auriculariales sp. MPI-PUGE-AT-0066]|nr:hypothetical protein BKA62DRAFT_725744 [Auriculariales sp. MPI-PUGE-AT-0066]